MSTLRFVIRTDKIDKSFKCPIELIYQISGQRKKLFLDYKVNAINWDAEQMCCIYTQPAKAKKGVPIDQLKIINSWLLDESEVKEVNESIASVRSAIREVEKRFELDRVVYSAEMIMQKLKEDQPQKTKKEDHKNYVFDFMDQYIADHTHSRVKGSLTVYKSVKNHLKAYQDYSKTIVRFDSIDYAFFQRFQNFLISHRKINNTTIAKALSTLKTFLGYARKQGIKVNDNYRDFQIKREKLEVIALTEEELQKLLNKDLKNNSRLRGVRDIFCFACATGLRYSDLAQLKHEHISNNGIRLIVGCFGDMLHSVPWQN